MDGVVNCEDMGFSKIPLHGVCFSLKNSIMAQHARARRIACGMKACANGGVK